MELKDFKEGPGGGGGGGGLTMDQTGTGERASPGHSAVAAVSSWLSGPRSPGDRGEAPGPGDQVIHQAS